MSSGHSKRCLSFFLTLGVSLSLHNHANAKPNPPGKSEIAVVGELAEDEFLGNADDKKNSNKPAPKVAVTPTEYRGAALPHNDNTAQGLMDRASENFEAGKWTAGLEVLNSILSGEYAKTEKSGDDSEGGLEKALPETDIPRGPGMIKRAAAPAEKPEEPRAAPKPDPVVSVDGIHYAPVNGRASDLLRDIPLEGRDVYRQTYDPPAQKKLEELKKSAFAHSLDGLEELQRLYPISTAGIKALRNAADRALDLGQSRRAAKNYNHLVGLLDNLAKNDAEAPSASLLARAAFAHLSSGQRANGQQFLDRLASEHPDEFITVAGEPVSGSAFQQHSLIQRYLHHEPAVSAENFRWSGPGGRVDRQSLKIGNTRPKLGARCRWVFRYADSNETDAKTTITVEPPIPLRQRAEQSAFPSYQLASSPDRIFFRSRDKLLALDAASGKVLWRALPELSLPTGRQGYATSAAHTLSLDEDQIYLIDRPHTLSYHNNKPQIETNQIFAVDANSGKLRWHRGGVEESDESIRALTFLAPPTPAGEKTIVTPASRGNGACVVGLSNQGEVRWITNLYDYNIGYMQRSASLASSGASLAVSSGVVISSPGLGIVAALDVSSGRLLWMTRYRVLAGNSYHRKWVPSEPVISAGRVIVAPYDSEHLTVLDLETGKTLWERSFASANGAQQLLGADDELVYVVGNHVLGIEIETGKTRFESETLERCAGKGFVADGTIYVPIENGIVVIDSRNGQTLEHLGWHDGRTSGLRPGNLALVTVSAHSEKATAEESATSLRLVAHGPWGLALVETLEESWETIGETGGHHLFERAGLLWSEARYEECMILLESMLETAITEATIERTRYLLVTMAREASQRLEDPRYLERVLARPSLKLDEGLTIALHLEMARILEKNSPDDAARNFVEVLRSMDSDRLQRRVLTPDGVNARLGAYVRDSLRELVHGKQQSPEGLDALIDPRLDTLLDTPPEDASKVRVELQTALLLAPFATRAPEARSVLLRDALQRGDIYAARAHADRLRSDYPALREISRIRDLSLELEKRCDAPSPPNPLTALAETTGSWNERFWKGVDEGFLVETSENSDAFPGVLALHGGTLKVHDLQGQVRQELPLPNFPDVEKAKSSLKSHIEEPASLLLREDRGILFTAAGIYELLLKSDTESTSGDAVEKESNGAEETESSEKTPESPELPLPRFELGWYRNYPHTIEVLHKQNAKIWNWGVFVGQEGQIFPSFLSDSSQRQGIVVLPNGSYWGLDLQTGKLLFRRTSNQRKVASRPWVGASRLMIPTVPSGLIVQNLRDTEDDSEARHYRSKNSRARKEQVLRAALVADVAIVLDCRGRIEVHDYQSRRLLWIKHVPHDAPILVHANGSQVWLAAPEGNLEARSLQSGRLDWSLPIPRSCSWICSFGAERSEKRGERSHWLVLSVNGRTSNVRYRQTFSRTGDALLLLQVSESGKEIARHRFANHGHTFTGRHARSGSKVALALNRSKDDGEWTSGTIVVDLDTGEIETRFERPIAGKGTGMAPRLARISPTSSDNHALAYGNSDGFGLFALAKPESEATADAETEEKKDEKGDIKEESANEGGAEGKPGKTPRKSRALKAPR